MSSSDRKVILSGIQPSGHLMLGNYLGALRQWVKLQETEDCLFTVVDLHAITVPQDPEEFRDRILDVVALYLACGIDPKRSLVFLQSHVPQHAELTWLLSSVATYGQLARMTQFKDKAKGQSESVSVGLFTYPVLMAADILIYQAHLVPVGDDQKQHLEFTRDVAQRFNSRYGETFRIPDVMTPISGARVMSLQDPSKKMSKSDTNERNYVGLREADDSIRKKIMSAVTDAVGVVRSSPEQPGITNLLGILSSITDRSTEELEAEYDGEGYARFKGDVADAVIELIAPIRTEFEKIRADRAELDAVLADGAARARERASETVELAYENLGFPRPGKGRM